VKAALLALAVWAPSVLAQPASLFEFHSGFWVNLHLFLEQQALSKTPVAGVSPAWQMAVDYYRKEVAPRDLLSDDMAEISNALSIADPNQPIAGLDPRLTQVLNQAALEYRERWWPDHDRINKQWIEAVKPLLSQHGAALKAGLERVYQTTWQADPVRTDVATWASESGAYTTLGPTHITISSTDPSYQGDAAPEMLFHEASHALIAKVRGELDRELKARQRLFQRRNFWHAVLFYTAGELTRRELTDYTPYAIANKVYDRGWAGALPVLEKDWRPYLDGKIDLASAVQRLVDDYGVAP